MKQLIVIGLIFCFQNTAKAQYYFNDIITTKQSNSQHVLLKKNAIKKVQVFFKDADNTVDDNFTVEQHINNDATIIVTQTATANSKGTLTSSYINDRISTTQELLNGIKTNLQYNYSQDGLLQSITSETIDTAMHTASSEIHVWQYANNQLPISMMKIVNNTDTTLVQFIVDEKGLIAEENWMKNKKNIETYYYYYNQNNQLTDIVRYQLKAKKMLPDYMFEYNNQGLLQQMIQVFSGTNNYNTWKYLYNENSLKSTEYCYDKQKKLLGMMEYNYIK